MKQKPDSSPRFSSLAEIVKSVKIKKAWTIAMSLSFVVCLAVFLLFSEASSFFIRLSISQFEVGKVAEKDIVADRDIAYIDEEATRIKVEAREKLVLPIFDVETRGTGEALTKLAACRDFYLAQKKAGLRGDRLLLKTQTEFPGAFAAEDIAALESFPSPTLAFSLAAENLGSFFASGIAAFPHTGLERFNGEYIELRRRAEGKIETEEASVSSVPTLSTWRTHVLVKMEYSGNTASLKTAVEAVIKGFILENAFFNAADSQKRLESARTEVEPVMRRIVKGEKIIRKGFIVSEQDYEELKAAGTRSAGLDPLSFFGSTGFFLILFIVSLALFTRQITGYPIQRNEFYLLLLMSSSYFVLAVFLSRITEPANSLPVAVLLPTGLLSMLIAILLNPRTSILFSLILSISLIPVTKIDATSFIFAFFSGVAGTFAVKKAEKRIDLVRAGLILAAVQVGLCIVLNLMRKTANADWLNAILWSAFNGFFCGILTLGFLPLLEQALNAPTRFRLMELSDLNAPLLKRLLIAAPGTYSHSVMVANLAESACREIGANALVARVGAYYHDIGKMEQPEYFVENQTSFNKHDELPPRLSATVIKSHVKLGVEKAKSLSLPDEVVDVISQHHGNGLITWFYDKAMKEEDEVKADDFTYPGQPPMTREAAVVMLADTVEAATRTLKKPTMTRLEQCVDDLIMEKFRQKQLSRSELTFKDLEAIKNTFVKILAGHFHSRIEYPKMRENGK